ncbi:hypothetical protein [Litoreibacter roseus]|uniref:Uncharacterized protein n=1 Tax=Litoreibacter roseus TaxID=2601869 RepID=A0A6N6JL80_9RHOB|nr:hypothetical protein [Litoreibacter roseus]GFE67081.1 hypothetical protein KIN_41550 [Litoreibacter roseus]
MSVQELVVADAIPRERLARYWTIIGSVLLVASIAQPIVSAQLAGIPPEDLLSPMTSHFGDTPLPDEVLSLFAGVFANIEFAFVFAAVKLIAGAAILYSARHLHADTGRPQIVLEIAAVTGVAAFIGIGVYFSYSSFLIASLMGVPLIATVFMAGLGLIFALLPARWLWRNFRSLRAL